MSKKSDPANITPLQRKFLNCMLSKRTMIAAYIYDQLKDKKKESNQDPYSKMFSQKNNADLIIPAISASVYADILGCLTKYLGEANKSGVYSALKQLKKQKSSYFVSDLTIQNQVQISYDFAKSSMFSMVSRLYSVALSNPDNLQEEIEKYLTKIFTLLAVTESMRQKVRGATSTLKEAKVEKVALKAEYKTAGDSRVCPICSSYQGKVMSIDEVSDLIPQHPGCRCWFEVVGYAS